MNRIHINGKGVNLDCVVSDCDYKDEDGEGGNLVYRLDLTDGGWRRFYDDERLAIKAWLSITNHMAGIIDPIDRDVMAWWERQKRDATENEA
jgi:hypothetical protein